MTVLGSPEELSYFGQIKSFNPNKGFWPERPPMGQSLCSSMHVLVAEVMAS